jgi:hypothetical protein
MLDEIRRRSASGSIFEENSSQGGFVVVQNKTDARHHAQDRIAQPRSHRDSSQEDEYPKVPAIWLAQSPNSRDDALRARARRGGCADREVCCGWCPVFGRARPRALGALSSVLEKSRPARVSKAQAKLIGGRGWAKEVLSLQPMWMTWSANTDACDLIAVI